jgi:hypothetical protein
MSNSDTLKHSPGTWTGLFAFKSRVVNKPEVNPNTKSSAIVYQRISSGNSNSERITGKRRNTAETTTPDLHGALNL